MISAEEIRKLDDKELLTRIMQESAEVIHAASKHALFGSAPLAAGVQYDNVRDTNREFMDLSLLMFEYRERFGHWGVIAPQGSDFRGGPGAM